MPAFPALVRYGEATWPFMRATAHPLHGAIPGAELRELPGQDHNPAPEVLAGFFAA